jgi:cystathionine gamma-synthase
MAFAAETICVQGSNERKDPFGAISMPIYQNAAYAHPGLGKSTGYDYSRCSNPTRDEVQKTVALLEQGTEALAFSTGMAAITALMEIFSPGDHLIATDDLYGGTLRLWNIISHKNGISVDCVDTCKHSACGPRLQVKFFYQSHTFFQNLLYIRIGCVRSRISVNLS